MVLACEISGHVQHIVEPAHSAVALLLGERQYVLEGNSNVRKICLDVGAPVIFSVKIRFVAKVMRETARALQDRGAVHLKALFPFGAEGTTAWLRAAAQAFGVDDMHFNAVIAKPRERAKRAIEHSRKRLTGKRISFLPDSQLEVPLARYLAQELGMEPLEVGTPYLHKGLLAHELDALPASVQLSEGQHVDKQLDRVRRDRPDLRGGAALGRDPLPRPFRRLHD